MSVSPEPLALLERAAELRARGRSWNETATKLSVTHDELRRLVAEQNRDYERLARRARADLLTETRGLALSTLCDLMQSPEERVRVAASSVSCRTTRTVRMIRTAMGMRIAERNRKS